MKRKLGCIIFIVYIIAFLCGCGAQGASAEENKEPKWISPEPEYGVTNNGVIGNFSGHYGTDRPFLIINGYVGLKQVDEHSFIVVRTNKYGEQSDFLRLSVDDAGFVIFIPNTRPLDKPVPDKISIYHSWALYYE